MSDQDNVEAADPVEETEAAEEVRDPAALLKAYEAEKEKRRALAQKLREQEELSRPENPVDPEDIRAEATREANARVAERIVRTELKAAAKGRLEDPADAFTFIDLSQFEVAEDGSVNETDINDAITELLEAKPYLSAQARRFHDSADGGSRKDEPKHQPSFNDLVRTAAGK